jgi:hypothetical protein
MINLDDYLSTQDEHFNKSAQSWYFRFSGSNKPSTEKPFHVFAKALYEVYFFIQDNLNKPFGCIEKINTVSETSGFNELEKLVLLDKIISVLYKLHDEKRVKVFIQLVDFRNGLSPYADDDEMINPKWHFDFEAIKTEIATIEAPIDRHKFLKNLLFDYSSKVYEIEQVEYQYYESIGFVQWIETELSRCEYEQNLESESTTPKTKPVFNLAEKKGIKTNLIRVLNALYELGYFEMANGQKPSKEMFMKQAGDFFGVDLSKYDSDLSQALNNTSLEANLKVFEQMKKVIQSSHYLSENDK